MSDSEVEGKKDSQKMQKTHPHVSLQKRGSSVEDLTSTEKQKNNELQKRSSSTPEVRIHHGDFSRARDTLSLREEKLKQSKKSNKYNAHETGIALSQLKEHEASDTEPHHSILSEMLGEASTSGEPPRAKPPISILSELLTHIPTGSSDYRTTADYVADNILKDILVHIPADERKSGVSVAHSVLSDLLSHLSSEVAAHKMSLDCEYLKQHLGVPLSLGLCELTIKRPLDPISYLAHWLYKWHWNEKNKQIREEEINALTLEREKTIAEVKERERIEAEQKAILELRKQATEAANITLEEALSQALELVSEEEGETVEETEEEGSETALL